MSNIKSENESSTSKCLTRLSSVTKILVFDHDLVCHTTTVSLKSSDQGVIFNFVANDRDSSCVSQALRAIADSIDQNNEQCQNTSCLS